MTWLILIGVGLIILALLISGVSGNVSAAEQARATVASAEAARAATLQGTVLMVTVGVVISLLIILAIVIAILVMRRQGKPQGQWVSGPNAQWGRISGHQAPQLMKQPDLNQLMLMILMQRMIGDDMPKLTRPKQTVTDEDFWGGWSG